MDIPLVEKLKKMDMCGDPTFSQNRSAKSVVKAFSNSGINKVAMVKDALLPMSF
jgi:hypothetical protein